LRALQALSQSLVTGVPAPSLALEHVSLLDNRADAPQLSAGGAVFASGDATLVVHNSLFSGNSTAYAGGAIFAMGGVDLPGLVGAGHFDIADCLFAANHIDQSGALAGQGAAITTYGPGGIIARSVFSNNVINDSPHDQDFSEGKGGALEIIVADGLPISIVSSEISGNTIALRPSAYYYNEGAGVYCYGGATPLTITDTTISGNQSEYGAAIESACNLQLNNSTIAGNFSPNTNGFGDAVELIVSGVFNAESTLIANPDAHVDLFLFEGANELGVVTNSLVFAPDPSTPSLPPDTIIGVDPLLAPLAYNGGPTRTHALLPGSPALDAGSNPQGLTFDQRGPGFPRTFGAAPDIGAFEVRPGSNPHAQP
jgi:predicted outer membrane repeat protein